MEKESDKKVMAEKENSVKCKSVKYENFILFSVRTIT